MSIKSVIAATAIGTMTIVSTSYGADAPSVVLVHGAWANGASWSRVIPLLQARGLNVVAVHNPLTSFDDDVTSTTRVINAQKGDVVLVGHSYGGAVITEAGNNDKVKALVYVAAFAPSTGQSVNAIVSAAPQQPEWAKEIGVDAAGALTWSTDGIKRYFAPDIPPEDAAVLAATQAPLYAVAFDGQIKAAAFTTRKSWYVIADQDQIIPAQLQEFFASSIKATASHVPSSHVPMLSHPDAVATAILEAVEAAGS